MRLKKDKDEDREENCLHIGSYKKKKIGNGQSFSNHFKIYY